jgi:hypothetical protein
VRGIAVFIFGIFASTAFAADPCRSKNYYNDLDKKPLTYWVFSPALQRCILVFSGNGFGGAGAGDLGSNGQGTEGQGGKGSGPNGHAQSNGGGDGKSSTPEAPSQKPSPSPEPARDVASSSSTPEFEITFHGTPKEFKSPPAPAPRPSSDKSPQVQSEPEQEKPKVPDLS